MSSEFDPEAEANPPFYTRMGHLPDGLPVFLEFRYGHEILDKIHFPNEVFVKMTYPDGQSSMEGPQAGRGFSSPEAAALHLTWSGWQPENPEAIDV